MFDDTYNLGHFLLYNLRFLTFQQVLHTLLVYFLLADQKMVIVNECIKYLISTDGMQYSSKESLAGSSLLFSIESTNNL